MIIVRANRWPKRDIKKRKIMVKYIFTKYILRSLISYSLWSKKYRFYYSKRFNKFTRKHSISFCRNNCSIRVIGKSTFRFSRMSRIVTKYYAS